MNTFAARWLLVLVSLCAWRSGLGAEPNASPAAPQRVWLGSMDEHDAKVGWGSFGKYGWAGFEPYAIHVNNLNSPHGLGMHPESHVEYMLHKRYRTFRGTAAMDDSTEPRCEWPVEFRVLGDGKLLWKSCGMHERSDCQACMLDVTGVDVLRLEVAYRPGGHGAQGNAHAVWIEPFVGPDPPPADVIGYFDPKPFARVETRADFLLHVVDLLEGTKFDELEALAKRYRNKDEYWAGMSALNSLYTGLEHPRGHGDEDWKNHFARLEQWAKTKPDSPTPRIALGSSYIVYGWEARGIGYAYTVTPQGGKDWQERVDKGREYLEEAMKLKPADPEAYTRMISVELLRDSLDETLKYFDEGRKIAPRYFPLYNALTNYLMPKWHGAPGDLEKHAARLRRELGPGLGDEIYFRMACRVESDTGGDDFFHTFQFKYEDLVPGIRIALREYPENNFVYNVCCHLACLAEDKQLAAQLLPRLDVASYRVQLWQGLGRLEYHRMMCDPASHAGDLAQSLCSHIGMLTNVAFLLDNDIVAAGEYPRFEFWDLASGESAETQDLESQVGMMAVSGAAGKAVVAYGQGDYAAHTAAVYTLHGKAQPVALEGHSAGVMSVAISRDGKRCATAARDNTARIWSLPDAAKPLVLTHPEWVYDAAFSRDGKTLATASFKGGVWLWDAETGKAQGEPLVGMEKGPWMCRVRFFNKSKRLVTASVDGTIRCWDLATRKYKEVMGERDIYSMEISPDDKWIAVGRRQGAVDLFSADGLKRVRHFDEHFAAIQGLSFSADSRTLASSSFDCMVKLWPIGDLDPRPVKQADDGTILLAAKDAQITGASLMVEGHDPENLGYWGDAADFPSWKVSVQKGGKYAPVITYSAGASGGGCPVELSCGDAKSAGTIAQTEGWYDYRPLSLPAVTLKAGDAQFTFRAVQKPRSAVMNLRSIVLTPAP